MAKMFWNINPASGDYVMSGGSPELVDSVTVPAYFRLKTHRTKWLYAPNTQYGSDMYTVKKVKAKDKASALEGIAAMALQPLVDEGLAEEIEVTTTEVARHGIALNAKITSAQGQIEELNLTGI